jgi:hypothetical protein
MLQILLDSAPDVDVECEAEHYSSLPLQRRG